MKCASVAPVPLLLTFLLVPLNGLTACGGSSGPVTPPTYTLSVSPQPASIPVNGKVTFTATTNDPSDAVTWVIVDEGNGTVNLGSPETGSGLTYAYTAPPTPPIFQDPLIPPGSIALRALDGGTIVQFTIAITAPSITTGFFSPSATSVAVNKTLVMWAYAVGSTNNAITMQVNGTTGGSTTYGTIMPVTGGSYGEYTYTAPATIPMSSNAVTITVISQADPTKSSSMAITLTSS